MTYRKYRSFCQEKNLQARSMRVRAAFFKLLNHYTPKFLADKILTSRSAIEREPKLVTVLFTEVADYTAISD